MKLPRNKSKRDQALDATASLAKTWSEWRLGKRASKSVSKGTKKASRLGGAIKGTPLKIAGAVALLGGVGAVVARKLKGNGHAEPLYTPPPPPAADAVAEAPAPVPTPITASAPPVAAAPPPPAPSVVDEPVVAAPPPIADEPSALSDEPPAPAAEPAPENADEPPIPDDPDAGAVPDPGEPSGDDDEDKDKDKD